MKLAVVFERFGPYHEARLGAAAAFGDLLAVELFAKDHTYDWAQSGVNRGFPSRTLLAEQPRHSDKASLQRLRTLFAEAMSSYQPDVLAVAGWRGWVANVAIPWALQSGVPILMMSESAECDHPRYWWAEWIKSQIVRVAGAGLVGGQRHRAYLNKLGMPATLITDGYDVVDNDYFARIAEASRADAQGVRDRLGLPEHYFFASARFIPIKNLAGLIRAYSRYSVGHTDPWSLVVAGDGPLAEPLKGLARSLPGGENVQFPGFVQYGDLPRYYGLASAFVLPSTVEPWGLVVNEAMAAGLPVLVSRSCGCSDDLVEDWHNGRLFEAEDAQALTQCMHWVEEAGKTRQALGARSRRIIKDWGTRRFARNVWRSAAMARKRGGRRAPIRRLLARAIFGSGLLR